MITAEIKTHPVAYAILLLGITAFIFSFLTVWPDRMWERAVIAGFAVFYFLWGVFTHQSKNQITRRMMGEYLFVSLLGGLLLLMLTF